MRTLLPLRRLAYKNAVEIYSISVRTEMTDLRGPSATRRLRASGSGSMSLRNSGRAISVYLAAKCPPGPARTRQRNGLPMF